MVYFSMRPPITCVNPGEPSAPSGKDVHTENVTPTLSQGFCRKVLLPCIKPRSRVEVFATEALETGDRIAVEVEEFWCDEPKTAI